MFSSIPLAKQFREHLLGHGFKSDVIYLFGVGDDGVDAKFMTNNVFQSKDIIITTNSGGRGIDIKISESVKTNLGLYVIITYVPHN